MRSARAGGVVAAFDLLPQAATTRGSATRLTTSATRLPQSLRVSLSWVPTS